MERSGIGPIIHVRERLFADRLIFVSRGNMIRWGQVLFFLLPLLLTLQFIGSTSAQTNDGRILGTVTDSQGKVVVGAKITITNTGTGATRNLESNGAGDYARTSTWLVHRYDGSARIQKS